MTQIKERLSDVRKLMKENSIAAYLVPGTDPHASEYFADCWKERKWISGFTGSAGNVALTLGKAGLWTDSRYFLQAVDQLKDTGIDLMKSGLSDSVEMVPWLCSELKSGEKVGVNSQMISVNGFSSMKNELAKFGIELVSIDLVSEVWKDRPAIPANPFFVYDKKYAGMSVTEKIKLVRAEMEKLHTDVYVLSALDDIAWLFNIRGNDVSYNPVTIAFAMVEKDSTTLFVSAEKCTKLSLKYLKNNQINVAEYDAIYDAIKSISDDKRVLIDGAKLNQSLYEAIPEACERVNSMSPVFKLKSIKNSVEIKGFKEAMIKDGVALTRFFMWLEKNLGKEKLSEISISNQLRDFRAAQEGFVGESFGTIAGYAGHGAIVHYSATPESDATLKPRGILLIDSGGQYLNGTTDITRTTTLGKPTKEQKKDYTMVLKGHIQLATAKFPAGTRGSQLDILARKAMWDEAINYGHGTGHGVGHFLNVHEGPQSIRMEENSMPLQVGMVMSNEPGLYKTDKHGIRTENLIVIVPAEKGDFGQFLKFETLTLCPIETRLIDVKTLTKSEKKWLNDYHKQVYKKLSKYLLQKEQKWLKNKTKAI